jgi:hypothetical protein
MVVFYVKTHGESNRCGLIAQGIHEHNGNGNTQS